MCNQLDVMHASSDFLVNVTRIKRKEINKNTIIGLASLSWLYIHVTYDI